VDDVFARDRMVKSIIPLASAFPSLIAEDELDDLQDQWKSLPNAEESLKSAPKSSPPQFWYNLWKVLDGTGSQKFGRLSTFMCNLMSLPHSSACVERVFSQMNLVKTAQTNQLHPSTVANRLLAKQALVRQDSECYSWEPCKPLVADVMYGHCHGRYKVRLQEKHAAATTVHVVDLDDDYDCIQ